MTADLNFNSQFADNLRDFILEKRGVGCKYKVEAATLLLNNHAILSYFSTWQIFCALLSVIRNMK